MSEAFVYCWTNHDNGKKYIGFHKGTEDDGYICSSRSKLFWEEFEAGNNWSRQIIAHGSIEDCQKLERAIFENIDWKSDEYYNLAVGGSVLFSLNNPMYRKEVREKMSQKLRGRKFTDEWKSKISASLTGKTWSHDEKRIVEHSDRMKNNDFAVGNVLSDDHRETLRQKALINNPMNNSKSRQKVGASKKGLKRLNKDGKFKMAKPNSDKWNLLISEGWLLL